MIDFTEITTLQGFLLLLITTLFGALVYLWKYYEKRIASKDEIIVSTTKDTITTLQNFTYLLKDLPNKAKYQEDISNLITAIKDSENHIIQALNDHEQRKR